ncbi:MAG TPA: hypothetical protein VFW28_12725 [Micropepsaceae bacterium]|nr:hypothetical protein [Micropepsaceae bacterium]
MNPVLTFLAFAIGGALLGLVWAWAYQARLRRPKKRVWLFPAFIGAVAGFVAWIVWRT